MTIETFDVVSYLDERGIDYAEEGKNVTRGWINMQCPYCADHSNHLGINLDSKQFHCWICGEKGSVTNLVSELEGGCSYAQVNSIMAEHQDFTMLTAPTTTERVGSIKCELPKGVGHNWGDYHHKYLIRRGFDPHALRRAYDLRFSYNIGKYKFRIIAPIIMDGRMVNFTAIDTVNSKQEKYRHCPNEKAVVPIRSCLYNLDTVHNTAVVVEGVTDVWRIGPGAIATFGIEFTKEQIKILASKKPSNIYIMYDAEPQATKQAEKLAYQLDTLSGIKRVEILMLPAGDPADMSEEDVREFRQEIFKE